MFENINTNDKNLINLQDRIKNQDNKMLFDNRIDEKKKQPDPYLTLEELCEWLNVKKQYVYDLVHNRAIPFVKLRRHLRFEKNMISKWLDSGCPERKS